MYLLLNNVIRDFSVVAIFGQKKRVLGQKWGAIAKTLEKGVLLKFPLYKYCTWVSAYHFCFHSSSISFGGNTF